MTVIPLFEADTYLAGEIDQLRAERGLSPNPNWRIFPTMRASADVVVFSEGYLSAMSEWWAKWKEATGFKYEPGSQMCESGTKIFIAHIHESLMPFRGEERVATEIVEQASREGHDIPKDKLGDFTPGAYEVRIQIPRGTSVNGVTDGGHSTPCLLVANPQGDIRAVIWEWQNGRWMDFVEMIRNGVNVVDAID